MIFFENSFVEKLFYGIFVLKKEDDGFSSEVWESLYRIFEDVIFY